MPGAGTAAPLPSRNPFVRLAPLLLAWGLALGVFLIYLPVGSHAFSVYDDADYIADNSHVRAGLTGDGIVWAFTTSACANYHPLTWIAHMLAWDAFGADPAGHHELNAAIHAASSGLLFALLRRLTRASWRSFAVAALFALHPLRVESVAWAAELKDVLSTFLLIVTLIAWSAYVRRPVRSRYALALLCYAAGLLAKPMLVTVPALLLLLDVWPMRRLRPELVVDPATGRQRFIVLRRLVWEKAPFALLAIGCSVATVVAQSEGGAVAGLDPIPLGARLANAVLSCGRYLAATFWPHDLILGYPHPAILAGQSFPWLATIVWGALLAVITCAAIALRRRAPAVFVGWLWFLVTLLPVIGLVQVGLQGRADRYTYVPSIGLLIAIVWMLPVPASAARAARAAGAAWGVIIAAALVALSFLTLRQIDYWQDDFANTAHALDCEPNSYVAHGVRGTTLSKAGLFPEAIEEFRAAQQLLPGLGAADLERGLAQAMADAKQLQASLPHFETALRMNPHSFEAEMGFGEALESLGRRDEALVHLRRAVAMAPDRAEGHYNLGLLLGQMDRVAEAIEQWRATIALRPDHADAHHALGIAAVLEARPGEAAEHFEKAVRLRPAWGDALTRLAWLRAASSDPSVADTLAAERYATRAIELTGYDLRPMMRGEHTDEQASAELRGPIAEALDALAVAKALQGKFDEAARLADAAASHARRENRPGLMTAIEGRAAAYRERRVPDFSSQPILGPTTRAEPATVPSRINGR